MTGHSLAVSAPGKVLFTGGFLVLVRQHTGLVLGLDARIHAHIEQLDASSLPDQDETSLLVLVQSPQFTNAKWLYAVDEAEIDTKGFVRQITDLPSFTKSSNKFVQTTICYVLSYLKVKGASNLKSCKITIMADESYYSQSSTSNEGAGGFLNFGCELIAAHKTGLGSSAALVSSLTAGLIAWSAETQTTDLPKTTIHNLAQAAHCAAQGKVGSGFDVAAAVFGACLYRRFTPTILESVGDADSVGFAERLRLCVDDLRLEHTWNAEILHDAVQFPKSLLLLMCDVDCGSETPGMVRQVLTWRNQKHKEADLLWNSLQLGSTDLTRSLSRLAKLDDIDQHGLQEVADIIATIRSLVREMSTKSGVPIEPPVITELLDSCTAIPGVVGGVAPGAGGYDAVALLVRNDPGVVEELETRLKGWKAREKSTGVTIGRVQLLKARQAYDGVRFEDVNKYTGWIR